MRTTVGVSGFPPQATGAKPIMSKTLNQKDNRGNIGKSSFVFSA